MVACVNVICQNQYEYQAVSGTIWSHRSILRKAWSVWDDDADGIVRVPEFRAGLKSVNILLDTPMKPKQVRAHITARLTSTRAAIMMA
eukprot:COSAG06_NODE_246_length_19169_cov_28.627950_8_plen_88_part_00